MTELKDPAGNAGNGGMGTGPVDPVDAIDRPRAWLTGVGLGALVLAALVIAFVIGTNYSEETTPAATAEQDVPALPQDLSGPGKDLFIARCGGCHTLADAKTTGTAGPDLDQLVPPAAVVEQALAKGGTGSGLMPPGLATGKDAKQVTDYVVAATGGS